jgi:hypothetical protein
MNATMKNTSARLRRSALTALSAFFVLTTLGATVTVSAANRQENDRRESWGEHERQTRGWRRVHPEPYYYNQGYVYAPPPVVYYPPPSPGINLILPLNFR